MPRTRTVREPDAKKLSALQKLHEKNATLKAEQIKLRDEIIKKNEEMRELVRERQALADEITGLRNEVMTTEPGSNVVVDARAVTEACCTPDTTTSTKSKSKSKAAKDEE